MARMTGFIFQDEYLERLTRLTDQELGRLVRALSIYHATGEPQELAGRESIAFDFIRADVDRIDDRYEARSLTNRNNRAQGATNVDEPRRTVTNHDEKPQDKLKVKDNILTTTTTGTRAREETSIGDVDLDPLIIKIQRELNGLTDTHYQALNDYRDELGDELVSYAIDQAVANGVRNWAYVEAILRGWVTLHIHTIGEAKARDEKHREKPVRAQTPRSTNPFLDAVQRGDFDDAG